MTAIYIESATLGKVGLAVSPLWEAVAGLQLVCRGWRELPWPYSSWAREHVQAWSDPAVEELFSWFRSIGRAIPRFLLPTPRGIGASIEDELAGVLATPVEEVETVLGERFRNNPEHGLEWLVHGVERYWRLTMQSRWGTLHRALQEDIQHRALVLATVGATAMLSQLPTRFRWEDPYLHLLGAPSVEVKCSGTLTLVPLMFGRGMSRYSVDSAGSVVVCYQARGSALLDSAGSSLPNRSSEPVLVDRLTALIGRGRAAILHALAVPSSTSTIANLMGCSASTVSQHLAHLTAAGMVDRQRSGGKVIYRRSPTAAVLISNLCRNDE